MRQRLVHWWIDDLFGPRRPAMFRLRIGTRILRLRLQLWWRRPKAAAVRHYWPKPAALLVVGVLVPILTAWLLSILLPAEARGFATAVHNLLTNPDRFRLEWREAAQLLLVLVGIPSAFLLWLFRDINVSGTLENQRKDVNLKEFQEIQMRAAGAMDEKLPAAARETLQIAALHQLRAFLRGEYGDSFRRPALELLRARFVASAEVTGTHNILDWMTKWRASVGDGGADLATIGVMKRNVAKALLNQRPNRLAETEQSILREEWQAIFRSGMPLGNSVFDALRLQNPMLADVDLSGCRLIGAVLIDAHLEGANLQAADLALARLAFAHLEIANLRVAHLEGAWLRDAHLAHANLFGARLEGADLRRARLDGANLVSAHLEGANLNDANVDRANLSFAWLHGARLAGISADAPALIAGARFDAATQFLDLWSERTDGERAAVWQPWLARGARRVDS
jgi:uncharacterized protein YjbI with pentapeptide repeats